MSTSIVAVSEDSHFTLANIPFGIFSTRTDSVPRPATRLGDTVVDLSVLDKLGCFSDLDLPAGILSKTTLNDFASLPASTRSAVRARLQELLSNESRHSLKENADAKAALVDASQVKMHLPVEVGDYTDFCASEFHTRNMGRLIDTGGPQMPKCWPHLPVGYHGRSSSIVVSGTPIKRPQGALPSAGAPTYGPCRALDYELEMAAILGGRPNKLGDRLTTDDVEENVFGIVIMNDWSARDIQGYEMVPLGPFIGKNFGTSISPWVVTLDALKPFKAPLQKRCPEAGDSEVLPYLLEADDKSNFDIACEVSLISPGGESTVVCQSNTRYLSFSFGQMLAHQTVGGCPIRPGDMLASGTISGPERHEMACLAEYSERGARPFTLKDGSERRFLMDGDSISITAVAGSGASRVGFGVCVGRIEAASE